MIILTNITLFFLISLIFLGGAYITIYEKAPIHERIQIFGVGVGIYVGVLCLHG